MNVVDDATARKWIEQALHDLHMAEKNLTIGGYDIAAFLSHQAVEKLLKGIIALQGKRIPRSHFIDEMGKSLDVPPDILEYLNDLSVDYQFARYPDMSDVVPYKLYTESIAGEKVRHAQEIFQFFHNIHLYEGD